MKSNQNQDEPVSVYDDPSIYDILMTPGTADEVNVLQRIHRRLVAPSAAALPWLEPACGSGRLLRVIAGRGRRVSGYDLSPAMVSYAARRLAAADLDGLADVVVADLASGPGGIEPEAFGFAFNTWNTIRHLMDDAAVVSHLNATARCLAPGGRYVLGLSLVEPGGAVFEEDVWTAVRGSCRVTQVVNYLPPAPDSRIELVLSHLTVTRPSGETHGDTIDRLRTYSSEEWADLLQRSDMSRVASLDLKGSPRGDVALPYQLEVLAPRS